MLSCSSRNPLLQQAIIYCSLLKPLKYSLRASSAVVVPIEVPIEVAISDSEGRYSGY